MNYNGGYVGHILAHVLSLVLCVGSLVQFFIQKMAQVLTPSTPTPGLKPGMGLTEYYSK